MRLLRIFVESRPPGDIGRRELASFTAHVPDDQLAGLWHFMGMVPVGPCCEVMVERLDEPKSPPAGAFDAPLVVPAPGGGE